MGVISPATLVMNTSHSADSILFILHTSNLLCDVNSQTYTALVHSVSRHRTAYVSWSRQFTLRFLFMARFI